MKPLLMLLSSVLLIQCSDILGEDPQTFMQPVNIIGEWIRVTETPSDVQGLYRKDTTIYQIGLDSLQKFVTWIDPSLYKPVTFKILYQRGGTKYGYLHEPDEEYDWELEESNLKYNLDLGLPEQTTRYEINFSVPKNCPPDTLRVTLDRSEIFGLKKRKGL